MTNRVIFYQWQKLHLGLDALSNQKILKGIYCIFLRSKKPCYAFSLMMLDLIYIRIILNSRLALITKFSTLSIAIFEPTESKMSYFKKDQKLQV